MFYLSEHIAQTNLNAADSIFKQAKELSEKINYQIGKASASKAIGIEYYFVSEYANALMYWQDAKLAYEKINDLNGVANMLSNMGAIYHNQSEYIKAMDLYLQSLQIAEEVYDTMRIGTVLQNIGAIHTEKGDNDRALEAYQKALPLFEAIEYTEGYGVTSLNIGDIYASQNKYELSMAYLQKALNELNSSSMYFPTVLRSIGEVKMKSSGFDEAMLYLDSAYNVALNSGDDFELARSINSIADAYENKGDISTAIHYYEKAKTLLQESNQWNLELRVSTEGLVRLYSLKKNYPLAFENQEILQSVKDSIFNLESDRKIDHLLFNFDLEKKESEIALLVKDKKIQEVEVKRQRGIKNAFIVGFIMVLLFAGITLIQRNRIRRGKKLSDRLLLNILPVEVANELKEKGEAEAQLFEQATVLFTDFKGFTSLSEKLSPKELVHDLHESFSGFDNIVEKYGIEKIKTIGDAYMASGGLPTPSDNHTKNVVLAALEIAALIEKGKQRKIVQKQPYFEIRIGIHTGPVVAGIVGVKKFQYDIWGDTVKHS